MTKITFRSDFTTEIVQQSGDDDSVLRAMLISTIKDENVSEMTPHAKAGRIRFLMKNRHGTPFEHNSLTFRSEAPIFVYREWHRHRIGVSINEQSGRYVELPPMFYLPPRHRPLQQVGKPGAYTYVEADDATYAMMKTVIEGNSRIAYKGYRDLLDNGVAREVARMVLPVNIYSSMYWTCNARSLMAFLSLRTKRDPFLVECSAPDEWRSAGYPETAYWKNPEGAMFPSTPMWEIAVCAEAMERVFAKAFPLTWEAFCEFGRVSP